MIINYGNPFSASLWIAAGGTSLWLCVQWRRRTVVILSALLIAALVALVQGVTVYRAAVASHSSTGGPIIAALSPVFALQAFLVVFPLAWGISGWILARRAETAERWARSILIVVVGMWIAWQQIIALQMHAVSVADPTRLHELHNDWRPLTRGQKIGLIQNPKLPLEDLADIPSRESDESVLSELAQSWRVKEQRNIDRRTHRQDQPRKSSPEIRDFSAAC